MSAGLVLGCVELFKCSWQCVGVLGFDCGRAAMLGLWCRGEILGYVAAGVRPAILVGP